MRRASRWSQDRGHEGRLPCRRSLDSPAQPQQGRSGLPSSPHACSSGVHQTPRTAAGRTGGASPMDRRTFLTISSLGFGGLMLPAWGRVIAAEALLSPLDVARKKALADTALQSAMDAGASYCDARIGRYMRQFVITREDKVQNVVNTESTGIGIRVVANGAWGFAATNDLSNKGVVDAARQATAIAKANARTQTAPVQLAKAPGVGEVAWKTPIRKNAMEVPIKDKVDLLLGVTAAATKAGADC